MTFYSVTLARTIWLLDDGPRTETCRSGFNVLKCKFYKFYICAVVGIIIEQLDNIHGVTTKIVSCLLVWLVGYFVSLFVKHFYVSSNIVFY